MRASFRSIITFAVVACLFVTAAIAADSNAANTANTTAAAAAAPTASPGVAGAANTNLLDLLVKKGILSTSEATSLRSLSGSAGMEQLLMLLKSKGVVNDSEAAELKAAADAEPTHALADTMSGGASASLVTPQAAQVKPAEPAGPTVIPAIAPVRVLPIDPPSKDNLAKGITLGSGARIMPYGFIKATAAYDSSMARGDDFPVPGFLNADTGPNPNPEFHIKARATRFGSRFEWPDVSKNITISGQIEADFEGNFSRVDNRNVSSIRSNALQLRLAYGRIDWALKPNTDLFFEAGQDWTIFGSSALMNLFETTFFGAYWGNLYERSPQFRLGVVQKLGGDRNWKISPEVAIMMPSNGDLPADVVRCTVTALNTPTNCSLVNGLGTALQLGYGERQGADYAKPEIESRVVLQFQLDKAPGVVPAQILWSGFYTHRQETIVAAQIPTCTGCAGGANFYKSAFPNGVDVSTPGYGNQVALSLPTRWLTAVLSGYMGADLRFFFAGQLLSFYNQPVGLTNTASGFSVDNNTATFGVNSAGHAVVAPQEPVRGYGGFVQLGFPISRWFNADPKGRNAGWQGYVEYGLDAANINDFRLAKGITTTGAGPFKGIIKAGTLFYKMNNWVQFGFEESNYTNLAYPAVSGADKGVCNGTKVSGKNSCSITDWRTEFGPVFTF
jgi:hypothetical protein